MCRAQSRKYVKVLFCASPCVGSCAGVVSSHTLLQGLDTLLFACALRNASCLALRSSFRPPPRCPGLGRASASARPPRSRAGGPLPVYFVPDAMAWVMLEFITPGAISTWSTELLRGYPSSPAPKPLNSGAENFALVFAKTILPLFTAFTIKKARACDGCHLIPKYMNHRHRRR